MTINKYEIDIMDWLLEQAENWRGSLVGNPDPNPLAEFDEKLKDAKSFRDYLESKSQ